MPDAAVPPSHFRSSPAANSKRAACSSPSAACRPGHAPLPFPACGGGPDRRPRARSRWSRPPDYLPALVAPMIYRLASEPLVAVLSTSLRGSDHSPRACENEQVSKSARSGQRIGYRFGLWATSRGGTLHLLLKQGVALPIVLAIGLDIKNPSLTALNLRGAVTPSSRRARCNVARCLGPAEVRAITPLCRSVGCLTKAHRWASLRSKRSSSPALVGPIAAATRHRRLLQTLRAGYFRSPC